MTGVDWSGRVAAMRIPVARDAALGACVAMLAATLFIEATFIASGASFRQAPRLLLAAAGYALLMSWFIAPLGGMVGLQTSRIAGDGQLAGILARSAVAAAFIALAGSLLLRAPVDVYRVMTHSAPFRDVATWWTDFRGTLLYFLWVGVYSFPWIAWFAWYRRAPRARRLGQPAARSR